MLDLKKRAAAERLLGGGVYPMWWKLARWPSWRAASGGLADLWGRE